MALAPSLAGVFRLVAIRESADGEEEMDAEAFGPKATGLLVYTASGFVSVSFMDPRRAAWRTESEPSDEELEAAGRGYSGYAGTYEVREADHVVLHRVQVAFAPNRVGETLTRFYTRDGDRLTLRPPAFLRSGREIVRRLEWDRLAD